MSAYVYVYFWPNGAPCYVGKGTGRRWLHEDKKHIPFLTGLPVVVVRSDLSEIDAYETEKALIAAIGREVDGGPLVNRSRGGRGGTLGANLSEEQRVMRRKIMKEIANRPDVKTALSERSKGNKYMQGKAVNLGRKHTAETRAKISAAGLGRKNGPHSDEARAKMAAAAKGRKHTAETCAKISAIWKGREQAPDHVARRVAARMATLAKQGGSLLKGYKQSPEQIAKRVAATAATKARVSWLNCT